LSLPSYSIPEGSKNSISRNSKALLESSLEDKTPTRMNNALKLRSSQKSGGDISDFKLSETN
jgi:hypothetical protein